MEGPSHIVWLQQFLTRHRHAIAAAVIIIITTAGHALMGKDSMTSKALPPVTNNIPCDEWQQSNIHCVHGPNQHHCCISNISTAC